MEDSLGHLLVLQKGDIDPSLFRVVMNHHHVLTAVLDELMEIESAGKSMNAFFEIHADGEHAAFMEVGKHFRNQLQF